MLPRCGGPVLLHMHNVCAQTAGDCAAEADAREERGAPVLAAVGTPGARGGYRHREAAVAAAAGAEVEVRRVDAAERAAGALGHVHRVRLSGPRLRPLRQLLAHVPQHVAGETQHDKRCTGRTPVMHIVQLAEPRCHRRVQ